MTHQDPHYWSQQYPSRISGQESSEARSYFLGRTADPRLGSENEANNENRTQHLEQDMEIGYGDKTLPHTFGSLLQKFLDEVIKLAKEQSDAEDAENTRHREKIAEINTRYQEKLSVLRAQQANRREELLRCKSQERLRNYQQVEMSHYPNAGQKHGRGYSSVPAAGATREVNRAYATNQFESFREQPQLVGGGRTLGTEGRVPYPEGRVYNNAAPRFYQ